MSTREQPQVTGGPGPPGWRGVLRTISDSPITGFAPWIVFSVLTTFVDFELAVGLALATAVAALVVGRLSGSTLKGLELVDTAFFIVLAIIGAVAGDRVSDWLTTWAGEFSNVVLVIIAVGSMLIRHPFTLDYAKEQVPREFWSSPGFLRTNYVITGAWAAAFVVSAVSGFIGDAVLDDSNNVWTGWVIQIAALIVAIQFTLWYPRVVRARARQEAGVPTDPPPPVSELLVALAGYLPIVGIVALATDSGPWWLGVGLIVVGAVMGHRHSRDRGRTAAREPAG